MLSFLELLDFKLLDNGKKICIWKGNGWTFSPAASHEVDKSVCYSLICIACL